MVRSGGAAFSKRVRIRLTNPTDQDCPRPPVVIPIRRIRKFAADFNSDCFAVAEAQRRVVIREYPSQADDLNGDGLRR